MTIGVIGLGKLGLPLASVLSKHYKVVGVDVDEKRIQQILDNDKFFEPHLNEYLTKHSFTVSLSYESLSNCNIVFIITQTPSLPNGKFDLQYVESALKKLHEVCPSCLAVISSTINIGDCDKLRHIHNKLAYNPEFIKQGSIINDFENPKFTLIGAYELNDGKKIEKIWRKIHTQPFYIVSPIEAEITKLSLNVSFTLAMTFANMIGELCEKFKADSNKVLEVIYRDRRDYTVGLGYGGFCFPRDVKCFKSIASCCKVFLPFELAVFLDNANEYMVKKYVDTIKLLGKKKIGVLGVAYKPNVPYVYESQPLMIAKKLVEEGYEVYVYDRLAEENAKEFLVGKNVHFCSSMVECIENSEVVFIGTSNYSKQIVNPWRT